MNPLRIAIAMLLFSAMPLSAADLTSIERRIAKEPAYAGKPKYCLLVFGPEAKSRVWLALDGDKLHIDRNGNGDLTDDGPALQAKIDGEGNLASRSFTLAELRESGRHHKELAVGVYSPEPMAERDPQVKELLKRDPAAKMFSIIADIDYPRRKGNGLEGRVLQTASRDAAGYLQFGAQPSDAPIIHFVGAWSITSYSVENLAIGRESDLVLSLGTLGIGAGTTAFTAYETLVPNDLCPTAEIEFPPKNPGEPPIKKVFELNQRC